MEVVNRKTMGPTLNGSFRLLVALGSLRVYPHNRLKDHTDVIYICVYIYMQTAYMCIYCIYTVKPLDRSSMGPTLNRPFKKVVGLGS